MNAESLDGELSNGYIISNFPLLFLSLEFPLSQRRRVLQDGSFLTHCVTPIPSLDGLCGDAYPRYHSIISYWNS